MPRAISIDALGAVIRIDCSALSDGAWDAARSAWQDAEIERAAELASATVTAQGGFAAQAMLSALSSDVTLAAIEDRAGALLMLHAAGLATSEGRVVALVGPSGRGKTTASRVLGREFGYVSDETVAIAADGTVLPYRKPLSLIEKDRLPKVQRSPTELSLRPLPRAPLRLAALVLLERTDDDANPPTLQRVGLAEGVAGLAQQASYLGRMSAPLHVIASHIEAVGGVHRITYSDAATLAPLIRELGEREPADPRTQPQPESRDASAGSWSTPRDSVQRWRRIPALDSLTLDDQRLALLVRDDERSARVVVLDGIGPTLWRSSAEPATFAALVEATVAAHGEPVGADAATLVAATLAELAETGLLSRD